MRPMFLFANCSYMLIPLFFVLLLDSYIYQLLYRTYVELPNIYMCIHSPSTPFIRLEYSRVYKLLI